MNGGLLLLGVILFYGGAYVFYGRRMKRKFGVDPSRPTPAHTLKDGVDFVPAGNWWILFGHHFSSICGAGPIVGPVLACAYWGWGVSLAWIVAGAVLAGAVSDFSALIMSVRADGKSLSELAGMEISRKARLYFSVFLWIALILVIAVFSIFAAKTFIEEPEAVVPSVGLIPAALVMGWLLYRTRIPQWQSTIFGLVLLTGLLFLGHAWKVGIPALGPLPAEGVWILLLLVYCYAASVAPVQVLLQPRDYLASFVLFALIGLGVVGVFWTQPVMNGPAFIAWTPDAWPKAGPLWPMLFVTIACGAISGFHSLVSAGTTCKQISSEGHACRIGYGGMLVESLVAVLVMIAVVAGLGQDRLGPVLKSGGPIAAFGQGFGQITSVFLGDYGKSFAILALNAFILTTLDTAARITRYLTSELFGIKNKHAAALVVVVASGLLAFSGKWGLLWPAFGAANQLIAGITLLIAACWLLRRGGSAWRIIIPSLAMLVTTLAAFLLQFYDALARRSPGGEASPDWTMAVISAVLIAVAVSILIEARQALFSKRPSAPSA